MNDEPCPRLVALSALADDMLAPDERAGVDAHVAACATCAAALADLRALQAEFAALPREKLGFDLGTVIEAEIARNAREDRRTQARPGATRAARPTTWGWLVGFGLPLASGAAALALGVQLGALLMPRAEPAAAPLAPVAVFDPLPPGSLCAGSETCFADTLIR